MEPLMTPERLEAIRSRFASLSIAIVGDVFLDKYLDIDRTLSDVSLETGKEVYRVVRIRCYPGAGGNVAQNLTALGVGRVATISVVGADGEGFDLKRALRRSGIETGWLIESPDRVTPTYTKPMMSEPGKATYEMERIDIENHQPLPAEIEETVIATLNAHIDELDGVIVIDQARTGGVVTDRVRAFVAELAERHPQKVFFADSRYNVGKFRSVIIKPNRQEAAQAIGISDPDRASREELLRGARALADRTGRPVVLTLGEQGLMVIEPGRETPIPAYRATGPTDIVGAGDSVTAGLVASLCGGASLSEAALIGNLVASITIQQIGVTGTATPDQVRARLREYNAQIATGK